MGRVPVVVASAFKASSLNRTLISPTCRAFATRSKTSPCTQHRASRAFEMTRIRECQSAREGLRLAWYQRYSTGPRQPTVEASDGGKEDGRTGNLKSSEEKELVTEQKLRALRLEGIAQAIEKTPENDSTQPTPRAAPQDTTISSTTTRSTLNAPSSTTADEHHNNGIDDASLPSKTAANRSVIVSRFHTSMERLLNSISIASQRVNTYTGTDYSGIEALRESIKRLESDVKAKLDAVANAKEAHSAAISAQSASQKEVVQLLERKHSWSAPDLERYMTLIRSEHINEQAVQAAREGMAGAERELEDMRARLEKYERRQYHEEQIWSDTIRRNSTWVTFGLMGVNILLLLFSLVLIEPWRRSRLVEEMKAALDERGASLLVGPAAVSTAPALSAVQQEPPLPAEEPLAVPIPQISPARDPFLDSANHLLLRQAAEAMLDAPPPAFAFWADSWSSTFALWRMYWTDLFSERRVAVRRVDLTAATVEGAVAGAACMGILFVLLRPR